MNITSNNVIIFAKEFEGKTHYRAGMSRKNQNNEYEKAYIDVRLPKGDALNSGSKINIKKGFLTFYKTKDEKTIWYVVIQDYELVTGMVQPKEDPIQPKQAYVVENYTEEQLDLPF